MESKKLQQMQQANSHLAPIPQTKPPSFHQYGDYRRSPVFQNHPQYQSLASNFAQITTQDQIHSKQFQANNPGHGGYQQQSPPAVGNAPHNVNQMYQDQIYQSAGQDKMYHQTARTHFPNVHANTPNASRLQQQFQALQQEKIAEQIRTQSEAMAFQQQTFAMRQQINPPLPNLSHMNSQASSMANVPQQLAHHQSLHQMQQQLRNVPPSSLNLTNQFQPAPGPLKLSNVMQSQQMQQISQHMLANQRQMHHQHQQALYHQQLLQNKLHQDHHLINQSTPGENQVPIIQQNNPGQVVNQSVQTQISGSQNKKEGSTPVTPATSSTPNTPTHQSLERKKSEPVHTLKSPVTKRLPAAPVAISGWLYKQGSEGLKVWRKRWFVLSEYCLFYYKGPDEEKILGSVLLPSYKISACLIEDKVHRKCAFKCEHTNMRTYVFAAETPESMAQWVRMLTLASMMQGSSESESQPSLASNPSAGDNSDSGNHTFQSQHGRNPAQGQVNPASDNGHIQPLYANAPPKPRRANDGGYSSPSPENSNEHYQQRGAPQQDSIYGYKQPGQQPPVMRQTTKTPDPALALRMQQMRIESKSPGALKQMGYPYGNEMRTTADQELYMQKMMLHQQQLAQQKYLSHNTNNTGNNTIPMTYNNAERRTPDTYGPPRHSTNLINRSLGDYEDIYNMQHSKQLLMAQQAVQQSVVKQPTVDLNYRRPVSPTRYDPNIQIPVMPARYTPNFLEQNSQAQVQAVAQQQQVQMREKLISSVARPHSADFLEYEARNPATSRVKTVRPKSSLDINRSPDDNNYYSEASYAEKMRQNAAYLMQQKPREADMVQEFYQKQDGDQQHQQSIGSLSLQRANRYDITDDIQGSQSVPRVHRGSTHKSMSEKHGERKREESMKRLLEWKQRMLQSPLTRKGAQGISVAQLAQPLSQHNLAAKSPLTIQNYQQYQEQPEANHALQRSRSVGYNSFSSDDEASVSVRNIRNLPKQSLTVKPDPHDALSRSLNGNINYQNYGPNDPNAIIYANGPQHQHHQDQIQQQYAVVKKSSSKRELNNMQRDNPAIFKNLNMSAGDLLNRTHEELILLLIQLRRQNHSTARAIEGCCTQIHEIPVHEAQSHNRTADGLTKAENQTKLELLKQQLADLEKQYEKSKPLVNLVDNMVKLGSLYRGKNRPYPNETTTLDRLEFNQRMQERKLIQEEQRQWDRASPNQGELQSKVQQLYKLDQLLQEESGTLQTLQRDKEDLERALYGLRHKMQSENAPAVAVEAARRQQHALERELSRVHLLLAENSKKLEQTVSSNALLEQELLVLRQKLQASRDSKNNQAGLGHEGGGSAATAVLESELHRVKFLVGDMQRQRQELSYAVRQLTDNSNSIYQEMNRNASHMKKRSNSTSWTETDLDSMDQSRMDYFASEGSTPLFIDTSAHSANIVNCSSSSKIADYERLLNGNGSYADDLGMESDDLLENSAFNNLTSQEKQEIKTVRIVKQESERRKRDRERTGVLHNLDQVMEEEAQLFNSALNNSDYNAYKRSQSLPRTYLETHESYSQQAPSKAPSAMYQLPQKYQDFLNSSYSGDAAFYQDNINPQSYNSPQLSSTNPFNTSQISQVSQVSSNSIPGSNHNSNLKLKTASNQSLTKSIGELSPVFQSEAARQIIIEMSGPDEQESNTKAKRRAVPKEKRRHFTAPHHVNAKSMQTIQSENDMNKNNINWRARDDLDMDLALRPRINAPDVVRSALGPREKISENTIDKLFGAPNKICIPERYIPEQPPELSPEEKKRRQEKVEMIKKMLSETTPSDTQMPPGQITAEKKQREHLLQLNHILAEQVMQMSKIVAENAMANNASNVKDRDELDDSPTDALPLYQQRENYFT